MSTNQSPGNVVYMVLFIAPLDPSSSPLPLALVTFTFHLFIALFSLLPASLSLSLPANLILESYCHFLNLLIPFKYTFCFCFHFSLFPSLSLSLFSSNAFFLLSPFFFFFFLSPPLLLSLFSTAPDLPSFSLHCFSKWQNGHCQHRHLRQFIWNCVFYFIDTGVTRKIHSVRWRLFWFERPIQQYDAPFGCH